MRGVSATKVQAWGDEGQGGVEAGGRGRGLNGAELRTTDQKGNSVLLSLKSGLF